jgi:hypothetical protein
MRRSLALIAILVLLLILAVYIAMNWQLISPVHDVAITSVAISSNQWHPGDTPPITVTTKNKGSVSESFNVSLYLNSSLLETQPVTDLPPSAQKNLLFIWNTSAAPVADYVIKAEAGPVVGETNTTDNTGTDGIVQLRSKSTGFEAVSVDPANSYAAIGQNITVNIDVSNVTDLYGWEFKLGWNNTVLELLNVTEGPFLKSNGATFFTSKINSTDPHIIVDCTRLVDLPEANANGALATITFQVLQLGDCDLNLYDTTLVNSFEQTLDHTTSGGHFETVP